MGLGVVRGCEMWVVVSMGLRVSVRLRGAVGLAVEGGRE